MGKRESDPKAGIVPLYDGETASLKEAAAVANISTDTARRWCVKYGIGRQPSRGAAWRVSLPALRMVMHGDNAALTALKEGKTSQSNVIAYFITDPNPEAQRGVA